MNSYSEYIDMTIGEFTETIHFKPVQSGTFSSLDLSLNLPTVSEWTGDCYAPKLERGVSCGSEVNDEFINSIYERESVLCESFEKDDFKPQVDFWNLQTQPIVNNWSSN
jgi:hypothetical protein